MEGGGDYLSIGKPSYYPPLNTQHDLSTEVKDLASDKFEWMRQTTPKTVNLLINDDLINYKNYNTPSVRI